MQTTPGMTPPPYAPTPPPRPGRPWWVWLLGGCAGCGVIALLAAGIAVFAAFQFGKGVADSVGPVTAQNVRTQLGADIPFYPGSTFAPEPTKALLIGIRIVEKMMGKREAAFLRGAGTFTTADAPDKVAKYYDTQLKSNGWKVVQSENRGYRDQVVYQKGEELLMLMIQEQSRDASGATSIVLLRGGKELIEAMAQQLKTQKPAGGK